MKIQLMSKGFYDLFIICSCYVKNMNGLDLALNPNLNPPLTLKKIKIMSMIKIKNACINKDCVRCIIYIYQITEIYYRYGVKKLLTLIPHLMITALLRFISKSCYAERKDSPRRL